MAKAIFLSLLHIPTGRHNGEHAGAFYARGC